MPIYEYACKNCEHTLEWLQKISDEPLLECPACGQPQLKRLISAPRFRLKGSGWYETDFKKDKQRNLAKGEGDGTASSKPETSESSSAGDKGSEDKSTAKTDKPVETKTAASKTTDSKSE